jgi:hypothetical protein
MRRVASLLIAAGALMLGVLTSASAGCYGGDCYDNGYRSYGPSYQRYERYSERPVYRSYGGGCRGDCGYSGRSRYHTVYNERPSYGYYDDYNDGSIPYYRSSCDYGGCGYRSTSYYGGGCGDSGCGYGHRRYSGCGDSGCGYGHRRYSGCGYYGCGYSTTVRYGGAWMQTGPSHGWNRWGGCRSGWGRSGC